MIRRARDTLRMRSVGSGFRLLTLLSMPRAPAPGNRLAPPSRHSVCEIYGGSPAARRAPPCPKWAPRAYMDFQVPEDLCAGYGYPQLTGRAKRKILGENLLRLHGMDVAGTKARLGGPARS
jgi:hypothetical protein